VRRSLRTCQWKRLNEYRLSNEEGVCSCCGGELHEMSTELRQELKIISAEISVVKQYPTKCCDKTQQKLLLIAKPAVESWS